MTTFVVLGSLVLALMLSTLPAFADAGDGLVQTEPAACARLTVPCLVPGM